MAIGVCRECGQKVSSEAAACPKCGAANPYKPKRVGVLGWIAAGFVGLVAFTMCTPREEVKPAASIATAPAPQTATQPAKTLAQIDADNRAAMLQLKPSQLRPILADKLLPVCERVNSNLNYIRAEVRGTAIYCVHSFYGKYSLSIGPLAKGLEQFIDDWSAQLNHAGIKRVGVSGTGEYASSSYFDLK